MYALGATGCLALVGISRPGTFLKATAYLSAVSTSVLVLESFGQRDLNRAVFKMDKIEPRPGKLWERTKEWTVEDVLMGGTVAGAFLALNPRALPGVYGWKRFVGASTIGAALGGHIGQTRLVGLPMNIVHMVDQADIAIQQAQYDRLHQDEEALKSLSRLGKLTLAFYSWPALRLPSLPGVSQPQASGATHASPIQIQENPHRNISQEEIDRTTLVQIEFNKGELKGPDIESGYRAYKDSLTDRDSVSLREWLDRLQEIRKTTADEAHFVWDHLATKEREFYGLMAEDRKKDVLRRELQLLNNVCSDFSARDAILAYYISDVQKRLGQIENDDPVVIEETTAAASEATTSQTQAAPQRHHSPHLVAEQIRLNWQRQKELLGFLERNVTMHKSVEVEAGSQQEAHLKSLSEQHESMKKNVEATERLLKEYEEQLRRADEQFDP